MERTAHMKLQQFTKVSQLLAHKLPRLQEARFRGCKRVGAVPIDHGFSARFHRHLAGGGVDEQDTNLQYHEVMPSAFRSFEERLLPDL